MAEITENKSAPGLPDENAAAPSRPNALVREYLLERLSIYRELRELRTKVRTRQRVSLIIWVDNAWQGWQNEEADTHFRNQRQRADNANAQSKASFFTLMRGVALELDRVASALTIPAKSVNDRPAILDLCMAPGGFAKAALSRNPSAILRDVSLPTTQGGFGILLHNNWSSTDPTARIYVRFCDITMLADEMGAAVANIPASHPDAGSFSSDRPFLDQKFDLVFCDGHVLRNHERSECKSAFFTPDLYQPRPVCCSCRKGNDGRLAS